jgi:hypothetical protein
MKHLISKTFLLVFICIFSGCVPPNRPTGNPEVFVKTMLPTTPSPVFPSKQPVVIPTATIPPEPTVIKKSYYPTTYRDEINYFQLDYPADWTLIPFIQVGSRGGQAQVYSPGSTAENLLEGGTRFTISVYDWDPKNDLTAYVNQRKIAWDASGQKIVSEGEGLLADGRKEMHFIVESLEKEQTFFLYTTVGEKYLQITGDGDLALIEEISLTVRPLD